MNFFKKKFNALTTRNKPNIEQDKQIPQIEEIISPRIAPEISLNLTKKNYQKNQESFELILLDILDNENQEVCKHNLERTSKEHENKKNCRDYTCGGKIQSIKSSEQSSVSEESKQFDSEMYEELINEEEEHQQLENMYIKDFILINKLQQARELTEEQWFKIIKQKNLSLYSMKNVYFSLFKGLKFQIRRGVWEVFANTQGMKKLTPKTFQELIIPEEIPKRDLVQIDKDVPRSKSVTHFQKELRNILIGYCAFSKKQYTQGMNMIAGSLLTLLALENDEELGGFQIFEKQFEERVFWVFIGVMVEKKWGEIFERDFQGLNDKLKTLQKLMAENTPAVYQKLIDYQWDLTIFSQFYITIMLYNSPINLSKIILDLFFLQGEAVIHSLLIRMMFLTQEKILGMRDECELMSYLKKDMIFDCYNEIIKDRTKAKKLQDFKINFMKIGNQ